MPNIPEFFCLIVSVEALWELIVSDIQILITKKAIRLNPIAPSWYFNNFAAMYRSKGNYKEALVWSEKAVKQEPEYIIGRVNLCSIYYLSGQTEEAHLQANEVMKLNPKFSLNRLEKTLPYKNPEVNITSPLCAMQGYLISQTKDMLLLTQASFSSKSCDFSNVFGISAYNACLIYPFDTPIESSARLRGLRLCTGNSPKIDLKRISFLFY